MPTRSSRWSRWIARIAAVLALLALSGALRPALASVTYEYTGAPYTNTTGPWDTSMRATATITFSSPLAASAPLQNVTASVTAIHVSDGVHEVDALTPAAGFHLEVETDAAQQIIAWFFYANTPCGITGIVSGCTLFSWGPQSLHRDQVILFDWHDVPAGFAENQSPGQWRLVPEPAAAALSGAGLALLDGVARRRRRHRTRS